MSLDADFPVVVSNLKFHDHPLNTKGAGAGMRPTNDLGKHGIACHSGVVAVIAVLSLLLLCGSGNSIAPLNGPVQTGGSKESDPVNPAAQKDAGKVLFKSGFEENEKLTLGVLIKQDGWFAHLDTNGEALSVSDEKAKSGSRSLKIDGSKVKDHPFGVVGGFYGRKLEYDPLKSGTPIIELSADVNLLGVLSDNQCGGGIAIILDGGALIGVGQVDTINFFLMNNSGADARGPVYKLGEWANVRAVFDYETKTVTGYYNGNQIARIPFEKNQPDKLTAVGVVMLAGPDKKGNKAKDLTGVTGHVDNLTVTAFVRPKTKEPEKKNEKEPDKKSELVMMRVPGGSFEMGMDNDPSRFQPEVHRAGIDSDELPVHPVSVNSFYMGAYQVTNRQYAEALNWALGRGLVIITDGVVLSARSGVPFCGTTKVSLHNSIIWDGNKFHVVGQELPADALLNRTMHPVVSVSWYGAAAYCNWCSMRENLLPAYDTQTWACDFSTNGYRLPTEAEREYASRGGLHKPYVMFPWGNYITGANANYGGSGDPWDAQIPGTTPVGYFDGNQVPPGPDMRNGYGLYDMAGNHFEWCHDWYDAKYYEVSPKVNPRGPATGMTRAVRNGSWLCHLLANLRCANRTSSRPENCSFAFRVVRPS